MAVWNDLLQGFGQLIEFLHGTTGSYGLAIVIITVGIRLAVWPLMQTQVVSMRRMQQLQPEIKRLQERFKNDRERLNQETMRLWRDNHVNPASGCLPMLIQLPFLWAIYDVLEHFNFHGATFLWLPRLDKPDPTYLIPILGGLTTFWQTRISMVSTPGQSQQQQMIMTYIMPLFIAWIFWRLPAGVGLYWVVSNFFSIAQQYVANRRMPLPVLSAAGGDGSAAVRGVGPGDVPAAPRPEGVGAQGRTGGAAGGERGSGREQSGGRGSRPRGRRGGGRS